MATVTFDLSSLNLPAGNYTVTAISRASNIQESSPSNSVMYIIRGTTEITFFISNFPIFEYKAIDGMTWGEWIESEYNTHKLLKIIDGFVGLTYQGGGADFLLDDKGNKLGEFEEIISGKIYYCPEPT